MATDIGGLALGDIGTGLGLAGALLGGGGPKPVQRVGDFNSGGGIAIGPGHSNVYVNGIPALLPFTPFTPHLGCGKKTPQHCVGVVAIVGNSQRVLANGQPLVLAGAKDSCLQHSRMMGSPNVIAA